MTNQQQADAMLMILLINGRQTQSEDCFVMCHDDVMMLLELIRERVIMIAELE
jgi:hypothetical protein